MGDKMGDSISKLSRLDSVRNYGEQSLIERNGSTHSRGQLHKQDELPKHSNRRDDQLTRLKPTRDSNERAVKKPTISSSEEEPLGKRSAHWEEQNNHQKHPSDDKVSIGVLQNNQSELLQSIVDEYKQTAESMLQGLQADRILWRKLASNLLDKQISAGLELSEVSFGRQLKKICKQQIKQLERILLEAASELDEQLHSDDDADEPRGQTSPGSCYRAIESIIARALKGGAPSAAVVNPERGSDAIDLLKMLR